MSGGTISGNAGKGGLKTAQKLSTRIKPLEINYDRIAVDRWERLLAAFEADPQGNNRRLRHRIRRVFRRTCGFSKRLCKHWNAFAMAVFYLKYGFV